MPGVAPAAIQMGRHAARNVLRALARRAARGRSATATRARWPPSAARPPSRTSAGVQLSGLPAWLAWLLIHIFFLIGFRNRLVVMFDWAWAYFTYQRYARLILDLGPRR